MSALLKLFLEVALQLSANCMLSYCRLLGACVSPQPMRHAAGSMSSVRSRGSRYVVISGYSPVEHAGLGRVILGGEERECVVQQHQGSVHPPSSSLLRRVHPLLSISAFSSSVIARASAYKTGG